jgi:hypothetical protein
MEQAANDTRFVPMRFAAGRAITSAVHEYMPDRPLGLILLRKDDQERGTYLPVDFCPLVRA